ncbi:right-handed parallel beta-helix repeat-containing protein [Clostridium estertheticum]|uniref:Right-handed parallel beta-helix repeat-containing protein n=1 Tax=Clostridium estertheticum TaxID=238834 RepID=A0AA47EPM3_9CLOT|nr:right-handed parallel beta-helix repeat-containing protein [Clostridium estertheticum]MBU3157969.1 right-handed parallel beta-helix repeat-containing protein [Clostridium estertheticum]WAG62433.1 right-handed parallel beta-helix repeat-containing protein [Clostridium estertheticum]
MQRLKNLCMVAALGAIVMGGCLLQSTSASAASIINVKAGGSTLSSALALAKPGDTIAILGTVTSGSVVVPAGVTISGTAGKGVINFSSSTGRGLTINTKGSTIKDLELYGAADNGIYMEGSGNNLINLKVHGNHDAGVQLSNGAANNTLTKVYSYSNADAKGVNADGFAIKLHSGVGNTLTDCTAEGNSDDGYDLYAAHGAVTFTRCKAINNGNCGGIKGDGNGFKVGGVDNKTPGKAAHLDPLNHVLIDCTATGNTGSGFDRNNQNGVVTMTGCIGQKNGKNNFNFPLTGAPSALGYSVTFGKAIMKNCTSINGTNNITGATLSGCIGF